MKPKPKLKIAVIGCVEFSQHALQTLIAESACSVGLVITRASSAMNSDFVDLSHVAQQHNIPFVHITGNDQATMEQALNQFQPDVIFCVGWSYLLKQTVLDIPKYGVVGYHPANIPENRGRHPLIWALVLGLKQTGSTFFLMDAGADTGKVLSQEPIPIAATDYARDLYNSMLSVALQQIQWLVNHWQYAYANAKPQTNSGNAWRKRGKQDGKIDWRMSADNIINLVRALSDPYPGAHFEYQGQDWIVWQAHKVEEDVPMNLEPGKLLAITATSITVKCGDKAVCATKLSSMPELAVGDYL